MKLHKVIICATVLLVTNSAFAMMQQAARTAVRGVNAAGTRALSATAGRVRPSFLTTPSMPASEATDAELNSAVEQLIVATKSAYLTSEVTVRELDAAFEILKRELSVAASLSGSYSYKAIGPVMLLSYIAHAPYSGNDEWAHYIQNVAFTGGKMLAKNGKLPNSLKALEDAYANASSSLPAK